MYIIQRLSSARISYQSIMQQETSFWLESEEGRVGGRDEGASRRHNPPSHHPPLAARHNTRPLSQASS